MSILKPCPFCGGSAHVSRADETVNVRCDGWSPGKCLGAGPNCYDEGEAIKRWNTRALSATGTPQVLRDALEAAHGHLDMTALRVSHRKDAELITAALASQGAAPADHFAAVNKMVALGRAGAAPTGAGDAEPDLFKQMRDKLHADIMGSDDESVTEPFKAWLVDRYNRGREGVAANVAWNAGFAYAQSVAAPQQPAEAAPAVKESLTVAVPGEIDVLRKALVYTAFALHGTPQHMLAPGITLIDGDWVKVKIGDVNVETGRVDTSAMWAALANNKKGGEHAD